MKNQEVIDKFIAQYSVEKSIGKKRIDKYRLFLGKIDRWLNEPFSKVNKDDLLRIVGNNIDKSDFAEETKKDIKVILKTFGKHQEWDVDWIKTSIKINKQKMPDELLSQDDILSMIRAAKTIRDKTIVSTLYESGARFGEIISVRLKHLEFNGVYVKMWLPESKTMKRVVPLVTSKPYLQQWVNEHPFNNDPNSYLFPGQISDKPLTNTALRKLVKNIAVRASVKKRIYLHLFRHSRATYLCQFLKEPQMRLYFGWSRNSRVPSLYEHLSAGDLIESIVMNVNGIEEVKREAQDEKIRQKECIKCNKQNPPIAKYCYNCSSPLDQEAVMETERIEGQILEFMKQPKMREMIKEFLISK